MIFYSNETVRRQDRLLDANRARELLHTGEYGVLSLQTEKGAYGIPVNFVWDGESSIYLHGAPEGRKLRCIERCDRVSFCIVGHTRPVPAQFTTEYESLLLDCRAEICHDDTERHRAIALLLEKYSPDDRETGMKYAEKSLPRTAILRLQILSASGKSKRL